MLEIKLNNNFEHNTKTLKESFLEIINVSIYPTKYEKDKLYYQLDELFRYFNLEEFRYKLEIDKVVKFIPLRRIDELAFKGFMSENIRKEKFERILED